MKTRTIDTIALTLLIIGGINWGLMGLFDYNLVTAIFGTSEVLTNIVYLLVAVSAVYAIVNFSRFR